MDTTFRFDVKTVILLFMAAVSLTIIVPVMMVSWQSMRAIAEDGCIDLRSGEVFNHVRISYNAIDSSFKEYNVDITKLEDNKCYMEEIPEDVNTGEVVNIETPGGDAIGIDYDFDTTELLKGSGVLLHSATGLDTYFQWYESSDNQLPDVVPNMIIVVSGLAVFISIGSLIIMSLPTGDV